MTVTLYTKIITAASQCFDMPPYKGHSPRAGYVSDNLLAGTPTPLLARTSAVAAAYWIRLSLLSSAWTPKTWRPRGSIHTRTQQAIAAQLLQRSTPARDSKAARDKSGRV